ncbi:hypothetical protein ACH5RR_009196 [Cinchona calisaya]|uniref:Uncharacterized protein n=1 Tax=Cinchona calisaya TaxID=153742 RepID=A0ABD3ADQ0_9GENT
MEAEERVLGGEYGVVLMNIELRIQELNDHLNPPALVPSNDDGVEEDPVEEDPVEVLEEEEQVIVEDN